MLTLRKLNKVVKDRRNAYEKDGFSAEDIERFPALRKRNFFCIQRHQARALHYDLRLQLDGVTFSWAIPKGLIGMSKDGESSRMAVETTIHPISYTTHEGSDGTVFKQSKRRAGTLLWDIGEYEVSDSFSDSDSDEERSKKRRRTSVEDEDPYGRHEEDKLRDRLNPERMIPHGKQRTFRLILKNGRKMKGQTFIFVLDVTNPRSFQVGREGKIKKSWFIRLPKNVNAYPWDQGGEDGDFWGRSVKTGRTFAEVCSSNRHSPVMFPSEILSVKYAGWTEEGADAGWEEEVKAFKVVDISK